MRLFAWTEEVYRDLGYSLRGLARKVGFTTAAVLSLALGIGASVAIFTVVDNLLLRPLPYRDPARLVMVWSSNPRRSIEQNVVSPADFLDWKAQNTVFESIAVFRPVRAVFSDGNRVEEVAKQQVTADLLPMLGVRPVRGRLFTAEDDRPGADDALLISYRLWQSWFGGDEGIIGRKVQVNATPRTVVGVMPVGFYFRDRETDLWEPLGIDPAVDYRKQAGRFMMSVARLKPGVSLREAQTQMAALAQRLEAAYPAFNKGWSVTVEPLRDSLVREVKPALLILLGSVGLLLLVACVNVANLLLARYASRHRELALRTVLGAGPRTVGPAVAHRECRAGRGRRGVGAGARPVGDFAACWHLPPGTCATVRQLSWTCV